jgi:hypothetical protein
LLVQERLALKQGEDCLQQSLVNLDEERQAMKYERQELITMLRDFEGPGSNQRKLAQARRQLEGELERDRGELETVTEELSKRRST